MMSRKEQNPLLAIEANCDCKGTEQRRGKVGAPTWCQSQEEEQEHPYALWSSLMHEETAQRGAVTCSGSGIKS